jgi:predicted amidohydrolase
MVRKWRATCIQMKGLRAATAATDEEARIAIAANLAVLEKLIRDACLAAEKPDLVLFPEFALQGPPLTMAVPAWIARACSAIPGPLTAPLQALAKELGIFIGGNMFEADPAWPGRYFNTSLLIGRDGEIALRYKRVNTAAFPSPHDFMDDYMAAVGEEGVFPVADTELGRICMIPCAEINVPEVARIFMMRGAEVILHPTNSRHTTMQEATKVARAAENMMYLVSANVAGTIGFAEDATELGGRSHILDYRGDTLAFDESADEGISVSAEIDIDALRRDRRTDTGIYNPIIRNRFEIYRPFYDAATCYPPNTFLAKPMVDTAETKTALDAAVANMEKTKILPPLNIEA